MTLVVEANIRQFLYKLHYYINYGTFLNFITTPMFWSVLCQQETQVSVI